MCPVCIANTAAIVAGAGSAGGILAVCVGKLKTLYGEWSHSISRNQGEVRWQ
jgi:hypothetical protein